MHNVSGVRTLRWRLCFVFVDSRATFVHISHHACKIRTSCNSKRVVSSPSLRFILHSHSHFRPSILSYFHPPPPFPPAYFPGSSILQARDYSNPEERSVFWRKSHRSRSQIKGVSLKGNPVSFPSQLRSTLTFANVSQLRGRLLQNWT